MDEIINERIREEKYQLLLEKESELDLLRSSFPKDKSDTKSEDLFRFMERIINNLHLMICVSEDVCEIIGEIDGQFELFETKKKEIKEL